MVPTHETVGVSENFMSKFVSDGGSTQRLFIGKNTNVTIKKCLKTSKCNVNRSQEYSGEGRCHKVLILYWLKDSIFINANKESLQSGANHWYLSTTGNPDATLPENIKKSLPSSGIIFFGKNKQTSKKKITKKNFILTMGGEKYGDVKEQLTIQSIPHVVSNMVENVLLL